MSVTGGDQEALLWGTPYRVLRRLRSTDRADTVLVERDGQRSELVLKILSLEAVHDVDGVVAREAMGERIRLEADALRAIEQGNVVPCIDANVTPDGRPYFVVPYYEGARTLREELAKRGSLSIEEAARIAIDVLTALEAAHAKGVVHRDVTPGAILLCDERTLLSDFGVVRVLGRPGGPAKPSVPTETGKIVGSPRFVAPEVALGRPADPRSDLYQVGLVLYECLTGRGPYDDGTNGVAGWVRAHAFGNTPSLEASSGKSFPAELQAVVSKALEKRPEARFPDARAFLEGLAPFTKQADAADTEPIAVPDFSAATNGSPSNGAPTSKIAADAISKLVAKTKDDATEEVRADELQQQLKRAFDLEDMPHHEDQPVALDVLPTSSREDSRAVGRSAMLGVFVGLAVVLAVAAVFLLMGQR